MLISSGLGFKVHLRSKHDHLENSAIPEITQQRFTDLWGVGTTNSDLVFFFLSILQTLTPSSKPDPTMFKEKSCKEANTSWRQKEVGADPQPICKICWFSLKTKREELDQRRWGCRSATYSVFCFWKAFFSFCDWEKLYQGLLTWTAIYRCVNKRPFYHYAAKVLSDSES